MYRTIADFVADWEYESGATLKLFRLLTDESLSHKISEEGRTLGFLAWHLVLSIPEMGTKMGFQVTGPAEESEQPERASEISTAYDISARSILEAVRRSWNDGVLDGEIDMYGEQWKRGYALASLVKHQIHHRAQMTVLMRQAGLKVVGIYGPCREEWAQLGMPAPK